MNNEESPLVFSYEAMGCIWNIMLWDQVTNEEFNILKAEVVKKTQGFETTYSRFISSSFLISLSSLRDFVETPPDCVPILRLYKRFYKATEGKFNPLIAGTLEDIGYDPSYSLIPKEIIREAGDFLECVEIIDDSHIRLLKKGLRFDFGGLGKGYFVDIIKDYLEEKSLKRFLVNGSGDMFYKGSGEKIRAGLEHPQDSSKAIGVMEIENGSLCSSASNRRKWGKYHHIIDATTSVSPDEVLATWVRADTTVIADGLATCLFFTPPEILQKEFDFQYCILNKEMKVKKSKRFKAELF
ncbi:MAG: FAD:protein FMN transferase [Candidatus Roizmanbacteria bacterium]